MGCCGRATAPTALPPPPRSTTPPSSRSRSGWSATAWRSFRAGARGDLRPAFEAFCHDQRHWLDDYALFCALKAKLGGGSYLDWPAELVRREPAALASARRELRPNASGPGSGNSCCFAKASRLKQYASGKGVRLLGDLPFYVSPDSSDVWAEPQLFRLDRTRAAAVRRRRASRLLQRHRPAVGQSRLRLGRAAARPATAGGSTGCARRWRLSTWSAWITSAPSPRPGTCLPDRQRRDPAAGLPARGPISSRSPGQRWADCRSSPRIWG